MPRDVFLALGDRPPVPRRHDEGAEGQRDYAHAAIHGESISKAMHRMRGAVGVADIGIHDMRRAISNWMKDQGISREVREPRAEPSRSERD